MAESLKCVWMSLIDQFGFLLTFSGQHTDSFRLLTNVNNKCEWIWKIYSFFLVYVIISTYAMSTTSILSRWMLHGDFDIEYFYHPVKLMSVIEKSFCREGSICTIDPKYTTVANFLGDTAGNCSFSRERVVNEVLARYSNVSPCRNSRFLQTNFISMGNTYIIPFSGQGFIRNQFVIKLSTPTFNR